TRRLRDALPPATNLTATDLNEPMLGIAESKFSEGENVSFKVANAMELPFDDSSFDLIVCQFGVMFFPDMQASFREAGRALRSGGRYLFNVWGSISENPFAQIGHEVAARFFPEDPPGFYKVPFGFSDQSAIVADIGAAGLRDATYEIVEINKEVTDWSLLAHGMVFGNPLIDEINERGGASAEEIEQAILMGLRERFGPEPSTMPLLASVYSGIAP
ncbi:MAG: class I SAM-dependent methyltransferase, partial [Rhodospirillales bacterium]|nr:class I SAM-dependent methyltransferase [Rhodospirillales bacterium]